MADPSIPTALLCSDPALIQLKDPLGAMACLLSFAPQHASVLFVRTTQLWSYPVLICLYDPLGGEVWLPTPCLHQTSVASVRRA